MRSGTNYHVPTREQHPANRVEARCWGTESVEKGNLLGRIDCSREPARLVDAVLGRPVRQARGLRIGLMSAD